jgi:regulatory protein
MFRTRRPSRAPDVSLSAAEARITALRLLTRREYTIAEITAKLVQRGCSADDTKSVVDALVTDGLLDDRRAAGAHVRTALRIKTRGRHRIARELESRGIDKALARDLLGDVTPQDEDAAIRRILAARRVPAEPDLSLRRKLFQHLMRRGFSADAIARVLKGGDENPDPEE